MVMKATDMATTGDKTMASTTEITDFQLTQETPKRPSAAPTRPPISACEEEEGRLTLHVKKFQMMAAISAANTVLVLEGSCAIGNAELSCTGDSEGNDAT